MWKIILTFGFKGDFNVIRKYTLKCKLFLPLYKLYETFHCAAIPLTTEISGDIIFPHSIFGCFFSKSAKIGANCTILHHVTIGSNNMLKHKAKEGPKIGDNCFIGVGAKIIGNITVGNNVRIGAGCIVVTDIPDNATVVMEKPKIIIREK